MAGVKDTVEGAPFILGLTGGIGMGKSTVSKMFQEKGIPVIDSDNIVHELYGIDGKAVEAIENSFPGVKDKEGRIDRGKLSAALSNSPHDFKVLESIVHPLVKEEKERQISQLAKQNHRIIVLDIPLLFETNSESMCDAVLVVSCDDAVQEARCLARPGMTPEKLHHIRSRQLSNQKRVEKADFVIDTGILSIEETREHVQSLILGLLGRQTGE